MKYLTRIAKCKATDQNDYVFLDIRTPKQYANILKLMLIAKSEWGGIHRLIK